MQFPHTFLVKGCCILFILACQWQVAALSSVCGSLHWLLLVKLAFIIKQVITQSTGSNSTGSGLININRTLNPNSIYLKASSETGGSVRSLCPSVRVWIHVCMCVSQKGTNHSSPTAQHTNSSECVCTYKAPIRLLISSVYLSSHSSLLLPHPHSYLCH